MSGIQILKQGYKRVSVRYEHQLWKPDNYAEVDSMMSQGNNANTYPGNFGGDMVRLKKMESKNGSLILHTSSTKFKYHVATRNNEDPKTRANPVFVGGILKTADDYLVLARMKQYEYGKGEYGFIEGAVHPYVDHEKYLPADSRKSPRISLVKGLERLVNFNVGVDPSHYASVNPVFYYATDELPVGTFLYEVDVDLDASEVSRIFEELTHIISPRFDELLFLPDDSDVWKEYLEKDVVKFNSRTKGLLEHMIETKADSVQENILSDLEH